MINKNRIFLKFFDKQIYLFLVKIFINLTKNKTSVYCNNTRCKGPSLCAVDPSIQTVREWPTFFDIALYSTASRINPSQFLVFKFIRS